MTQEASAENLEKPEGLAAAGKAGAAVYVVGAVQALSDGRWDVRCLFYDAVSGEQLDSIGVSAGKDLLRMAAHRCADRIYTRLTGEGAMFASQIAYVAQLAKRRYELIIADSDGWRRAAYRSAVSRADHFADLVSRWPTARLCEL